MKIEFQFNSVQIDPQDIQKYYTNIISAIGSYPVVQKTPKRRTSKKILSAGDLINEILADIEK